MSFSANRPDSLMEETQSEKTNFLPLPPLLLLCSTSGLGLISIYECVFDAAFKVPSTQHLTAASLYRSHRSPRTPVLKQSIIKEQLSAITLSDPNGISSATLKVRHFSLQLMLEASLPHLESDEAAFLHPNSHVASWFSSHMFHLVCCQIDVKFSCFLLHLSLI